MASTALRVGGIDERGYIHGMTRRGYTHPKCLLEDGANRMDAFEALDRFLHHHSSSKKILYEVGQESINITDNAIGMDEEGATNMFSMHRQNHSSDSSRGVSGIGIKPAMLILSQYTTVNIYTRKVGSDKYLHIIAPWGDIWRGGVYTGMISVREMTEEEKAWFVHHREENAMLGEGGEAHGTTIQYSTNDMLRDLIHANFSPITESDLKDPLDRLGCVFGHDDVAVTYKDYERGVLELRMYNYFGLSQHDYYKGYSTVEVEQWTSRNPLHDRFIWRRGEQLWEINKLGRGYSKKIALSINNLQGYTHVGNYTVKVGLRCDNDIFDPSNPKVMTAGKKFGEYNLLHVGKDESFISHAKLVRNNQIIGLIPMPDISISSSRGNDTSVIRYMLMQCEVSFNPVSNQLNDMDRAMNIQENKNQHNGESLPFNFTRLIKTIKEEKINEVWKYFQSLLPATEEEIPEEGLTATVEVAAAAAAAPAVVQEEAASQESEEEAAAPAAGEAGPEPAVAAAPFQPPQEFRPLPPHDVSPFRRGGVYGEELSSELQRVLGAIQTTDLYRDTKYVELFNLLRQFE
jgi:hypothetical protein